MFAYICVFHIYFVPLQRFLMINMNHCTLEYPLYIVPCKLYITL